jgi:hypothetical protein
MTGYRSDYILFGISSPIYIAGGWLTVLEKLSKNVSTNFK